MSRAPEVSGQHSAVLLGMYKAHADSTGVELVVVDLLLFVSCGCWYTNHRYAETPSRNDKPVNRSRSQNRHVERVGDGNLRLLRGQGLRRRLLRQALLRAPPVSLEPPSVLRPHACFAASLAHRGTDSQFSNRPALCLAHGLLCVLPCAQGSPCIWGAAMEKAGHGSCCGCCLALGCCAPCTLCQVRGEMG